MSFFDKLKSGIEDAGVKARTVVEVNRLKLQINSRQKDIDHLYQEIGKQVVNSITTGSAPYTADEFASQINKIQKLENEIQINQNQIKIISNEQECVCGKAVPLHNRFCPDCGRELYPIEKAEDQPGDQ